MARRPRPKPIPLKMAIDDPIAVLEQILVPKAMQMYADLLDEYVVKTSPFYGRSRAIKRNAARDVMHAYVAFKTMGMHGQQTDVLSQILAKIRERGAAMLDQKDRDNLLTFDPPPDAEIVFVNADGEREDGGEEDAV